MIALASPDPFVLCVWKIKEKKMRIEEVIFKNLEEIK